MLAQRDYDGIILDLLDDIIQAEKRTHKLIDRLDSISRRPSLRVIDVDMYLYLVAASAAASMIVGIFVGMLIG
jgi:hypothetical protein